ncbi:hypothetical protein BURKHO8Y_140268 [Burkholderia sp. 8Y]|nr:hypothetical protein BURKHO8Y_140268 [Burkholderia sp. 8Y]
MALRLRLADLEPRFADARSRARQGARLPSRAVSVVACESRHAGAARSRAGARSRRLLHRHGVPARRPGHRRASRRALATRNGDGFVPAGMAAVHAHRRTARCGARVRHAPRCHVVHGKAGRPGHSHGVGLRERSIRHHARLREPNREGVARKRHAGPGPGGAAQTLPGLAVSFSLPQKGIGRSANDARLTPFFHIGRLPSWSVSLSAPPHAARVLPWCMLKFPIICARAIPGAPL